jgi:hypothetical protein
MFVIPKIALPSGTDGGGEHPLVQIGLLCAAWLFVSILLLTDGIDLSPGLL